jgi:hypothetical protein
VPLKRVISTNVLEFESGEGGLSCWIVSGVGVGEGRGVGMGDGVSSDGDNIILILVGLLIV